MVNSSLFSPETPHFFQPILSGSKSHLNIPVKFFSEHIEGKHEGKTVTLRSDALGKTWKVKMEGQRLTRGWKEFVEAHVLGVGDIVIFRHERDLLFHVTALGPNCCEIQYTPSGSRRQEDEEESDELERPAKEVEKDLTKIVKLTPTSISFETGRQHLPASFTKANGLIKPGKIILVDRKRSEWVMELKVEKIKGSMYMYMYITSRNGWRTFCGVNGVKAGESLTLELVRGGAIPMLKFCSKVNDDDENAASEEELYPNKTLSKKRARTETEPSSENTYLVAHVTPSNLRRNHMYLSSKFARSNGLNNRQCEIDLRNEHGKSWTLDLRHNKTTGQSFVRNGWRSFCRANGIKAESFCRFKFVQNGTRPVLQLCPNTEADEVESEDCSEPASMNQNRTVALQLKPYMFKAGTLRIPASFGRANGIKEAGTVTIVNRDGVEWKLRLGNMKGSELFYIRGLKDCFVANGIEKVGDSFTLEGIRGGANPILKISSKEASFDRRQQRLIQASRVEKEKETRVQKKARVSAEGGPSSHRTRASNRSSAGPNNLQGKQPLQPCSISDQVAKVKQSVVDALTDVRQFRSQLEIKENNLESSLLEIDVLGEKIMGISKLFNINQV
ncbi:hypothetical protein Bca52824_093874 [Brassica carinata]|uniref:TF-B3 domain-containing protein n=1 Tax=Brassica carinata TaxID=52824 RepID=A0A8X7TJM1_BRACI|nr:hypothetical protein Bca52824_093874 [Brassica carinata]